MTDNLSQLLLEKADARPDLKIGMVDDQRALADVLALAAGGAEKLKAEGLGPRNRVALVAGNSTDYLVSWMACLLAGIPVALINPAYPIDLLAEMMERLNPALVITDLDPVIFSDCAATWQVSDARSWPEADARQSPGVTAAPSAVAGYMHTSGTTGVPKFCGQTHSYFLRLGRDIADILTINTTDRVFTPLSLFHVNPLGYAIIGGLTAGADVLSVEKFSASGFWDTVREHEITVPVLHAPPVQILKRSTTTEQSAGHRIRTMFWTDREFMERFGIDRAVSCYGSTEVGGLSHLKAWHIDDGIPDFASRDGGLARHGMESTLDGNGQILVKETVENTMFSGYLHGEDLVRPVDDDGWFETGDLGRVDEDGGLVFIERAAESIRVKGEYVPITYVEDRLGEVPGISDLALWRTRSEQSIDDEVVLYVVSDDVPVDAVREASATLPRFMQVQHIARIESIPRDKGAGKIQRRLLDQQDLLSWETIA